MWVIAVLSPLWFKLSLFASLLLSGQQAIKSEDLKEQRVDGSWKSRNLDFLKCTLVAGKPVFGRKIHSHSDNSRIGDSMYKRFIHTTRSSLDP